MRLPAPVIAPLVTWSSGFRHAEASRGHFDQRLACGRRRLSELHAANLDRQAPPGRTLVRGQRRVALDQRDAVERQVEFLGHNLAEGGPHTGAEIDLAGIDRDPTVGADRKEPVDLVGCDCLRRRDAFSSGQDAAVGEREGDDEGALQEVAPALDEIEHIVLPRLDAPRGVLHGAQDALMRSAPAEIVGERLLDLCDTRVLVLCQQRHGADDHAV